MPVSFQAIVRCLACAACVLLAGGGADLEIHPARARAAAPARNSSPLAVGFASAEITPRLDSDQAVWLAGYGVGRRATGVHDPLWARAVVFRHAGQRIALVSVDLIGLMHPEVLAIRRRLDDFDYVLVSSTHNHHGPDVIGLWGRSHGEPGVDPAYLSFVVNRVAETVRRADAEATPAEMAYGTAQDDRLLGDSRLPRVVDGRLRVLVARRPGESRPAGLLVQWNCHPEALSSRNPLLTSDFPHTTIATLAERWGCPVAYFSGAVGGLMAPPGELYADRDPPVPDGSFALAEVYGRDVAALADRAIEAARPVRLTPFRVATGPIAVPLENPYYHAARLLGTVRREARRWTGDWRTLGPPLTAATADARVALASEVAAVKLGELTIAAVPGELYPELVYGQIVDPPEPGADFPRAAPEPNVAALIGPEPWLLLGLANDELGYLIPERQWDWRPPFCYGKSRGQYGEVNSCGPQTARIVLEALAERIETLRRP